MSKGGKDRMTVPVRIPAGRQGALPVPFRVPSAFLIAPRRDQRVSVIQTVMVKDVSQIDSASSGSVTFTETVRS